MKRFALAAAALVIGAPAFAQTATPQSTTPDQATTTTAQSPGQTPKGGYEPTKPALSAQPEPGQKVIFVPSPSPDEAFPPPAPMESYPVCERGQTDHCRQRGG